MYVGELNKQYVEVDNISLMKISDSKTNDTCILFYLFLLLHARDHNFLKQPIRPIKFLDRLFFIEFDTHEREGKFHYDHDSFHLGYLLFTRTSSVWSLYFNCFPSTSTIVVSLQAGRRKEFDS